MGCSVYCKVGLYQFVKKEFVFIFCKSVRKSMKIVVYLILLVSSKTNLAKSLNAKKSQIIWSMFIQIIWLLVNISYWEERRQEKGCDE